MYKCTQTEVDDKGLKFKSTQGMKSAPLSES